MHYDLLIIGAGPAGYVAAIRAGQLGLKTALIEKKHIGGMCLNWGCIPSKAMLESAKLYERIQSASRFGIDGIDKKALQFNWTAALDRANRIVMRLTKGVKMLLEKNRVELLIGPARITSASSVMVGPELHTAKHIFIATGSVPEKKEYPVPAEMRLDIADLFGTEMPPEALAIIGATPTALELALLLSMTDHEVVLLVPGEDMLPMVDPHLSRYAAKMLKKRGVSLFLNARITGHYEGGILLGDQKVPCQRLLNAEMRQAVLPAMDIALAQENGFLKVNEYLQTSEPTLFAIGDVNGKKLLAHSASKQGLTAVNYIQGIKEVLDFHKHPINIYAYPEIAQVGLSEPEIQAARIEYKVSEFPLSANGKAMTEGNQDGFIRLLSDQKYGEVLGVQIVAPNATDMIAEAALILEMEGTVFDVANVIHAHPTVSEIFLEAGFVAIDKAIHI
jgi:dihydrolipoamide dehydrogenase